MLVVKDDVLTKRKNGTFLQFKICWPWSFLFQTNDSTHL